ncbi:hypothetical protein BH10PSE5_BH10PSE5_32130 [soil metagenome]
MRDYRDAKVMAASLRKALQQQHLPITHSQSLELTAKAFGLENWNVLAARIEAARRPRPAGQAWTPGQTVVMRNVLRGKVTHAHAAIVVEDRPQRLILYTPLGGDMRVSSLDWDTGLHDGPHPQRRHTTDALVILTPGAGHAVTVMFHGGGGPFICWYVDLQEPFRRVPDGIVTCDQQLDIVIGADLRWRWKDEDHLARIVELGWITPAEARAIRREGEGVIERITARAAPFNEPWPTWRADPNWELPELPDDWNTVPAYG